MKERNKDILMAMTMTNMMLTLQTAEMPGELLYKRPSPGDWSAAEVMEYVIAFEGFVGKIMAGNSRKCPPGRDPEEKVGLLHDAYEEIRVKFHVPSLPIFPGVRRPQNRMQKGEIIMQFQQARKRLYSIANSFDLKQICLDFEHPDFGGLTRAEWFFMVVAFDGMYHRYISNLPKRLPELNN